MQLLWQPGVFTGKLGVIIAFITQRVITGQDTLCQAVLRHGGATFANKLSWLKMGTSLACPSERRVLPSQLGLPISFTHQPNFQYQCTNDHKKGGLGTPGRDDIVI